MNIQHRSQEEIRKGMELLQNFLNATGDYITRAPIIPIYDGGYFKRLKQAFTDYNAWLQR